jgi:hypothetical protein
MVIVGDMQRKHAHPLAAGDESGSELIRLKAIF